MALRFLFSGNVRPRPSHALVVEPTIDGVDVGADLRTDRKQKVEFHLVRSCLVNALQMATINFD